MEDAGAPCVSCAAIWVVNVVVIVTVVCAFAYLVEVVYWSSTVVDHSVCQFVMVSVRTDEVVACTVFVTIDVTVDRLSIEMPRASRTSAN